MMEDWERRIEQRLIESVKRMQANDIKRSEQKEVELLEKWWALPTRGEDTKC